MGTLNIIGNYIGISLNISLPKKLGAVLYIPDFSTIINGYFIDKSGKSKQVQAATTTVANDSLIMTANDADIIAAVTLAGCYSIFYTTDSTPKTVKLSDILQNYGTSFYFDEWNKRKMCLFSTALDSFNHERMMNYIQFVNWVFPTGVINFSQTIDFTKIFGKLEKN